MCGRIYPFLEEPRGEAYVDLLRYGRGHCSQALLVVRPKMALSTRGRDLLARLTGDTLFSENTSKWPGTELLPGQATVTHLNLSDTVVRWLFEEVDGLFEWQQSALPEDLCLLRDDGSVWLTTVSHEHDAFLTLTSMDLRSLQQEVPTVAALLGEAQQ